MKTNILFLPLVLLALIFLNGCKKQSADILDDEATDATPPVVIYTGQLDALASETWWSSGAEILARCLKSARNLQHLTSDFLDEPNNDKLIAAQQSWQQTREAYRAFYAHHNVALSEPQAFHLLAEIDFRIAAWPIQPGSLDSFGSYLYAGLVHDVGNPLTMENLLNLHGQIDSENGTLGIFAIEYMLFGENGTRSPEDYAQQIRVNAEFKERGFNSPSELPNNRRRMLLTLQTGKLVEDLELLVNSWNAPGAASQLTAWTKLSNTQQYQVLSATLEQGLAQLLVNEDEEYDSIQLLAALKSLQALPALLKHPNTHKMGEEFGTLTALLSPKITADEAIIDWPKVTSHINTLSKLFTQPTVEKHPNTDISEES